MSDPAELFAFWITYGDEFDEEAQAIFEALPECVGCGGKLAPWTDHSCGFHHTEQWFNLKANESKRGEEATEALMRIPAIAQVIRAAQLPYEIGEIIGARVHLRARWMYRERDISLYSGAFLLLSPEDADLFRDYVQRNDYVGIVVDLDTNEIRERIGNDADTLERLVTYELADQRRALERRIGGSETVRELSAFQLLASVEDMASGEGQ